MQIHVCTLLCLRIRPSLLTMCCLPGVELGRAWDEGLKFSEKEITQKGKLLFAPEMYSEKKKKKCCAQNHGATSLSSSETPTRSMGLVRADLPPQGCASLPSPPLQPCGWCSVAVYVEFLPRALWAACVAVRHRVRF